MKAARVQVIILLLIPLPLSASKAYGQKPSDEAARITVTTVESKDVALTQQYVCQIHARHHIDVRAPAEGYIEAILVKEGQAVKKGDVIYQIGPILYQARLDAAKAERDFALLEFNNTKRMFENKVITQYEVKLFEAKLAKAQAQANLAEAELNFTRIRAPFDGMVGRPRRQLGSFVQKGETLTTFSDNSLIYADFRVPEARYLEYSAETDQKKGSPAVVLVLANGKKYYLPGKIATIGAEIEAGNATFRADFPNPERLLRHGQTGTVWVSQQMQNDAIVIPQRATFEARDTRYVYVVDKDRVAHLREIVVQNESGDLFVIKKGVEVGDKIVLDGVSLVRDGGKMEFEDRQPKKVADPE
jgi:membrane fusion protein, multidrug efflux system